MKYLSKKQEKIDVSIKPKKLKENVTIGCEAKLDSEIKK